MLLGRCWEEPLAPFEPSPRRCARSAPPRSCSRAQDPGAGARHRLFDAVDATLAGLAAERGLLLVIDDLHWADHATLLLTSFLLRSGRPAPLLVLGTYRDTELGRHSPLTGALAELQRDGALDRIGLRGLEERRRGASSPGALLGADDAVGAPRVHARTDGNAFFAEQVLRGLADSPEVPESVRHAVGVRLSRLSEAANELLAAAAVLGLELDPRALAGTAALEPAAAEAALDEVLRARLLRRAAAGERFEFAHALVREAVYDELNVLRRARLHRRAAEALRALGEDRHLEEIAAQLLQAASPADAREVADLLVRAGRRALERLAYEDAAERFERALEALALADAEDEAGPVLLARGDALLRAGDTASARGAFDAAARLARRRGDPRCWRRPRSASPASASRSSTSTPRRSRGSRRRSKPRPLPPRCARGCRRGSRSSSTTRRTAPAPRPSAPRRSPPRAAPATRARSPPRSTPATSRCGAPTASRSGSRRPPT